MWGINPKHKLHKSSHWASCIEGMAPFTLIGLLFLLYGIFSSLRNRKFLGRGGSCCYMLGYQCYKGPEDRKLDTTSSIKIVLRNENLGLDEYRFLLRTIVSSGLGEETYGPKAVITGQDSHSHNNAILEMEETIFSTLDKLFSSTNFSPKDINILVVNVSVFSPSPSLTSLIVNHYKMREDIKTFNLSGMGCSATLVAIDLVKNLFKSYDNSLALVVSTEAMGPNWYLGKERSMLLANCLFRSGGCSMILTNDLSLKGRAILKLTHLVRTHLGSNDEAYQCGLESEDELGYKGFLLSKSLPKVAAKAIATNFKTLAPKILPLVELLRYIIVSFYPKKIVKQNPKSPVGVLEGVRASLNLKSGVDHFCIHTGSRKVIDGVGENLGLSEYDLEPSRMALHRFGNTSTGGIWYALSYLEAKKRLKKGNKILMIGLGTGFKCNNCVWEVLKDLEDVNVWKDCVDRYPPRSLVNPFMKKYGWINDEYLNFVRLDQNFKASLI